jgi:hypothetical protein
MSIGHLSRPTGATLHNGFRDGGLGMGVLGEGQFEGPKPPLQLFEAFVVSQ